jgi:hypothetical protein
MEKRTILIEKLLLLGSKGVLVGRFRGQVRVLSLRSLFTVGWRDQSSTASEKIQREGAEIFRAS